MGQCSAVTVLAKCLRIALQHNGLFFTDLRRFQTPERPSAVCASDRYITVAGQHGRLYPWTINIITDFSTSGDKVHAGRDCPPWLRLTPHLLTLGELVTPMSCFGKASSFTLSAKYMDLEKIQWGTESMERASSEQCSRASSGDHASTSSGLSCSLADHVSNATLLSTN